MRAGGKDGRARHRKDDRGAAPGAPHVPASGGLHRAGKRPRRLRLRGRRHGSRRVVGVSGGTPPLVQAVGRGAPVGPAPSPVVRRWEAERLVQLPRSPSREARRTRRVLLDRRAGRPAHDHLRGAPPRRQPVRQCAQGFRGEEGRSRRHLPTDDPRATCRDAGVCPHRCRPLGGVRRVLRRLAQGPHQRCGVQSPDHRRRQLPARSAHSPERERRRGREGLPLDRERRRRAENGRGHRMDRRARPLVPRADPRGIDRVPRGRDGCRGHALHPVHVGNDGETQGDSPHDRGLHDGGLLDPQPRVRSEARDGCLLVRGRYRLGHGPQLHRLRPPRERSDLGDVRGSPRPPRQGSLVADHR